MHHGGVQSLDGLAREHGSLGSMVAETEADTSMPVSSMARRMAMRPAFRLRVSAWSPAGAGPRRPR